MLNFGLPSDQLDFNGFQRLILHPTIGRLSLWQLPIFHEHKTTTLGKTVVFMRHVRRQIIAGASFSSPQERLENIRNIDIFFLYWRNGVAVSLTDVASNRSVT